MEIGSFLELQFEKGKEYYKYDKNLKFEGEYFEKEMEKEKNIIIMGH